MHVSPFAFFYTELGFVWQSLEAQRVFLSRQTLELLTGLKKTDYRQSELTHLFDKEYAKLRKSGILTTDEEDELIVEKSRKLSANNQIQGLYLIVTTICNLNCTYCLYGVSGSGSLTGEAATRQMSTNTAAEAVHYFATLVANNDRSEKYWEQITFYGGEPLLNTHAILAAIPQVRAEQKLSRLTQDCRIVINTNATLIHNPIIDLLIKEGVEFQVSIDGHEKTHNLSRLTKAGNGSYDEVIEGLKLLHSKGASIVPMITVSENNLDEIPTFVPWLVQRFDIREYNMNVLMSGTGNTRDNYPETAARQMMLAASAAKNLGAEDFGVCGQFRTLEKRTISTSECGTSRKITVFPNGDLHSCQALERTNLSNIGTLENGIIPESRNLWLARTRFNNPDCLNCPAIAGCGGGCAAGSYHATGKIDSIDPNKCRWTRTIFENWITSS